MPLQNREILNNRYRIIKQLGQGNHGFVYHTWDLVLEIHRVIKEFHLATPEEQEQFLIHARTLENLSHPNLPKVIGHFVLPEQEQYLVTEYIEGINLQEILDKQWDPLPETSVLPWIEQVCDALFYLHSQSPPIIHHDIKPANIKITPEGKAMLVDPGFIRLYGDKPNRTLAEKGISPGYSSPEQYEGGEVTPLSNLYALGATLYNLLTGQVPVESIQRVISDPLLPSNLVNPAISPGLATAISQAMHPDPNRRPRSVLEFKNTLSMLSPTQPTQQTTKSESSEPELPDPNQKNRPPKSNLQNIKKWLPWAVGGILLVVLVFILWPMVGEKKEATPTSTIPELATSISPVKVSNEEGTGDLDEIPTQISTQTQTPTPTKEAEDFTTPTQPSAPTQPAASVQNIRPSLGTIITSTVDGMRMVYIPPGDFQMGSNTGDEDEKPVHNVTLDAYWMDQTEVTNVMYAQCVEAGYCDLPDEPWRLQYESLKTHPVVSVSWNKANAYCEWAGRRLPTEAEWEKAAGWDPAARTTSPYPWGEAVEDCSRGNYMQVYRGEQGQRTIENCVGNTTPVGFYPSGASYYGVLDMAGNVWEWVQDWYGYYYYSNSPASNPSGPESGFNRVARGGSWDSSVYLIMTTDRSYFPPDEEKYDLGFRCAHSAETETLQASDTTPTPAPEAAATQVSPIDSMVLVYIPAGEFLMGSIGDDPGSEPDEYPQHSVFLDGYWMDQIEVTNAMYQDCVAAAACEPPNAETTSSPSHPMLYVSWYQAKAYCSWAGRRLPTEAEWEKAARGGIEGARYPWGDEDPVCDPGAKNGAQYSPCDKSTLIGKTFAPNGYGLYDMAGNVWEWVSSFLLPYPYDARYGREDMEGDDDRVLRGGSWLEGAAYLRVAYRFSQDPNSWSYNIGFRCALTP